MATPIVNNTTALQELLEQANNLPEIKETVEITDDTTGLIYKLGIDNGLIYIMQES